MKFTIVLPLIISPLNRMFKITDKANYKSYLLDMASL